MKIRTCLWMIVAGLLLTGMASATPLGPHYKPKWSQAPDMDRGTDVLSMHRTDGPVVADDFVSDGRAIAGFHWWGSYLPDPTTGQEWITGQGAERSVSFEISFHQNCPAGDATCGNGGPYPYSTPSNGNYFSAIVTAEEDFYGTTAGGENVYEYWLSVVGIPGPEFLDFTWNEVAGETYWVDFAWYAGQFSTDPAADIWGWHQSSEQNLDLAVQTNPPSPGGNPHLGPWNVLNSDMAFEVLTVPEPSILALLGFGLAGLAFTRRRKLA